MNQDNPNDKQRQPSPSNEQSRWSECYAFWREQGWTRFKDDLEKLAESTYWAYDRKGDRKPWPGQNKAECWSYAAHAIGWWGATQIIRFAKNRGWDMRKPQNERVRILIDNAESAALYADKHVVQKYRDSRKRERAHQSKETSDV